MSVPTHFYKVVLADNGSGKHGPHSAAVGAFVMPNSPIDPGTPLTAFAVPLDALEAVSGACPARGVRVLPSLRCCTGHAVPPAQHGAAPRTQTCCNTAHEAASARLQLERQGLVVVVGRRAVQKCSLGALRPPVGSPTGLGCTPCAAGTRFFPGFVNEKRRLALDATALDWQQQGQAKMKVGSGGSTITAGRGVQRLQRPACCAQLLTDRSCCAQLLTDRSCPLFQQCR